MSRLSGSNLLILFGTFAYVGLVGLVVYGYSRATPFAGSQQPAPKAPPVEVPVPKAEDAKKAEPKKDEPAPRVEFRRPVFGGGFRGGFGKRSKIAPLSDRLGVRLESPDLDTIIQLGLVEGVGLVVEEVRENSPAADAGLKVGDILLELGGRDVPDEPKNFDFQLSDLKAGEPIDVGILRDGRMWTLRGLIVPEAVERTFPFRRQE